MSAVIGTRSRLSSRTQSGFVAKASLPGQQLSERLLCCLHYYFTPLSPCLMNPRLSGSDQALHSCVQLYVTREEKNDIFRDCLISRSISYLAFSRSLIASLFGPLSALVSRDVRAVVMSVTRFYITACFAESRGIYYIKEGLPVVL